MKIPRLISIGVLLMLIGSTVTATETVIITHDGVWWKGLARSEKVTAIEGMLVGFDAGYNDALTDVALFAYRDANKNRFSSADKYATRTITLALRRSRPNFSDRTFGTMVNKIDEAYAVSPKLSKTMVSDFVLCAAESGQTCLDVAKVELTLPD